MYTGSVLVVDLDRGEVEEGHLPKGLVEDRVGGALLALEYIRQHADGDPIVIASGPLTGALVPAASAAVLSARSPLTGGVVHCSLTNHAGPELKYTGYDVIVVRGSSPRPVSLWVHDEQAELVDAGDLTDVDASGITDAIRRRQGDERVQVLAAGPACQSGSLAGALTVNHWASTDRAAVGTLMASKGLLALAARGMGELEPADTDGFGPAVLRLMEAIRAWRPPEGFSWDGGRLEQSRRAIAPLVHRHRGCFFCTSRGRPYLMLDEDPALRERSERRAPGVLVADLPPLGDLTASGLDGRGVAEVTRTSYRLGLDPARAARAVREAGARDTASATRVLEELAKGMGAPPPGTPMVGWDLGDDTGGHDAFVGLGVFTPANPPLVPTLGVEGAEGLLVLQGLAYILGLCPSGSVGAGMDADALEEVVEAATGLGLSASALEDRSRRLVRETLAMGPDTARDGPATLAELRGRFA